MVGLNVSICVARIDPEHFASAKGRTDIGRETCIDRSTVKIVRLKTHPAGPERPGSSFPENVIELPALYIISVRNRRVDARSAQNAAQRAHAAIRGDSHETKQAPDVSRACAIFPDVFDDSEQKFSGEDRIRTCGRV